MTTLKLTDEIRQALQDHPDRPVEIEDELTRQVYLLMPKPPGAEMIHATAHEAIQAGSTTWRRDGMFRTRRQAERLALFRTAATGVSDRLVIPDDAGRRLGSVVGDHQSANQVDRSLLPPDNCIVSCQLTNGAVRS